MQQKQRLYQPCKVGRRPLAPLHPFLMAPCVACIFVGTSCFVLGLAFACCAPCGIISCSECTTSFRTLLCQLTDMLSCLEGCLAMASDILGSEQTLRPWCVVAVCEKLKELRFCAACVIQCLHAGGFECTQTFSPLYL